MHKAESVDPEPEDPAKSAKTELSREKKGVWFWGLGLESGFYFTKSKMEERNTYVQPCPI